MLRIGISQDHDDVYYSFEETIDLVVAQSVCSTSMRTRLVHDWRGFTIKFGHADEVQCSANSRACRVDRYMGN